MRHPLLDADEIIPGLWQGGFPLPGHIVATAGFQILVLCARELQVPGEAYPQVQVIHAPNDDHPAMPLTREKLGVALDAAKQVAQAILNGDQVLVTCAKGLNRSGLVSALAIHQLLGWAGAGCIERVQTRRRKQFRGHGALSNREFREVLSRLRSTSSQPDIMSRLDQSRVALWMPKA